MEWIRSDAFHYVCCDAICCVLCIDKEARDQNAITKTKKFYRKKCPCIHPLFISRFQWLLSAAISLTKLHRISNQYTLEPVAVKSRIIFRHVRQFPFATIVLAVLATVLLVRMCCVWMLCRHFVAQRDPDTHRIVVHLQLWKVFGVRVPMSTHAGQIYKYTCTTSWCWTNVYSSSAFNWIRITHSDDDVMVYNRRR